MKKILIVLTNVNKFPTTHEATGLWLAEATEFVSEVQKAGYILGKTDIFSCNRIDECGFTGAHCGSNQYAKRFFLFKYKILPNTSDILCLL